MAHFNIFTKGQSNMKSLSFCLKFADAFLKWGLDLLTCNDLKMFLKQKTSVSQNINFWMEGICGGGGVAREKNQS